MRDLRVSVGEIALQVRDYEGDGETILFLHFGGGNLMMWQRVTAFFEADYRLLLVDLRDHGKSDKPQKDAHIDVMAEDVIGLMDALKIERAHVVGSSLGAEVGLSMAANFPKRVSALVCEGALHSEYGPYGNWDGSEAEFEAYAADLLAQLGNEPDAVFDSVAALVEANRPMFERDGWWNPYVEALFEYGALEVGDGRFTVSWQNRAVRSYLEHYFGYRFEDYYRRVQCPLLMLPGEVELKDVRIREAMVGLCQLASQGTIVAVPGWVHPYGWLLEPDEVSKVVLGFLAEAGAKGTGFGPDSPQR